MLSEILKYLVVICVILIFVSVIAILFIGAEFGFKLLIVAVFGIFIFGILYGATDD